MFDFFETILKFMETGGNVLWVIFLTTLALWILIVDKLLFFKFQLPELIKNQVNQWNNKSVDNSWQAHRIREAKISQVGVKLSASIPLIKTLVAICPFLGLLGTVTGMVAVFDVMAITGTGNARMMASGISMATIPTMAGMVAALSGLYFGSKLESRAKREKEKFGELLNFD